MPKQVRIRRGTTAQHASFAGAEGEITFDTTKKVLVLHDGVTAGGLPLEGWLKLNPGGSLVEQILSGMFRITGGDADHYGLAVDQPTFLNGQVTINSGLETMRLAVMQETLVYGATVNLNFRGFGTKRLALAGDVTLTTSNLGFGREVLVRMVGDGSARGLAFPAGWKFVGGSAPVTLAAGKTALLRLWCFGVSDADVVAHYLVEP